MNDSSTHPADDSAVVPEDPSAAPAAAATDDLTVDRHDADSETSEAAVWSRFGDGPRPALPKTAGLRGAYRAAADFALPEDCASALANGAVDPAALRGALNNPTRINVAGGVIEVIDIDLYTPALVPLPTNNRTMDMRVYPAGGAVGYLGPLTGPRSQPGQTCGLWIEAHSVQHALDEAKQAQDYLLVKNPLKDSVAARGIVMPVTAVYFELRHPHGQPPIPLLGPPDASSPTTPAHPPLNPPDPPTPHPHPPAHPAPA